MNWEEKSVFQKIVTFIGCVCAIIYIFIGILVVTNVLPNLYDIARVFLGITYAAIGVQYWPCKRALAIFWIVCGVVNIVTGIVALLI